MTPWQFVASVIGGCLLGCVLVFGCERPAAVPDEGKKAAAVPVPEKPLRAPLAGRHDLQVVAQAFQTNEAAAEEKYANRRMVVDGSFKKVEKTEKGDWRVRFEWFVDGFNFREGKAVAIFPASEGSKFAPFEYRSPIAFEGRCDGLETVDLVQYVVFRDCRIVLLRK